MGIFVGIFITHKLLPDLGKSARRSRNAAVSVNFTLTDGDHYGYFTRNIFV